MKIAIIIFIVISSIFAIATLVYVAVDIILERRKKEERGTDRTHSRIGT